MGMAACGDRHIFASVIWLICRADIPLYDTLKVGY